MAEEAPVRKFVTPGALNRMAEMVDMPRMRAYRAAERGVLPPAAYVDGRPVFDPANPAVRAIIDRKGTPLK